MLNSSFNNTNKRGVATIKTTAVTVSDAAVTLTLPNNAFWGRWYQGLIVLEVSQTIAEDTTGTLPVVLSVNGETRNLTSANGTNVQIQDLAGDGAVFIIYYDKPRNLLQLMTGIAGGSTAG